MIRAVLVFGLVGTGVELALTGHYEDAWQLVPLALVALSLVVIAWHAFRPGKTSLRGVQTVMALCVASGALGVALHFRGAAEFQKEIDPSIATMPLVQKVMRAKAPPVLAPGMMVQLGLLGLVFAHRWSR